MTRRLRALASLLTAAAVIALLVVFGLASSSSTWRGAPALPREVLGGSRVTLSSLLAGARGRAAVVVFWAYRLTGLPTTFVVDTHGRIRRVLRGPQSAHSLQVALTGVERS
jgi:hypothetical protein